MSFEDLAVSGTYLKKLSNQDYLPFKHNIQDFITNKQLYMPGRGRRPAGLFVKYGLLSVNRLFRYSTHHKLKFLMTRILLHPLEIYWPI